VTLGDADFLQLYNLCSAHFARVETLLEGAFCISLLALSICSRPGTTPPARQTQRSALLWQALAKIKRC